MEFSKKIALFIYGAIITITIFSMFAMWQTKDLSPLSFLIPAWFGLATTATGFYFWKAKHENSEKYRTLEEEKLKQELENLKHERKEFIEDEFEP